MLAQGFREAVRAVYRAQDYYRAGLVLENALWNKDHDRIESSVSDLPDQNVLRNMDLQWTQSSVLDGRLDQFQAVLSWESSGARKESLILASYAVRIEP